MNQVEIKQKATLWYFTYKGYVVPLLVIIVCVALIIIVVIPQLQAYLTLRSQYIVNKNRLDVLQANFKSITGFNETTLSNDFTLVSAALPQERDAVSVINVISRAASYSNIGLKDYSFDVGKITPGNEGAPESVTLSVSGDLPNVQRFLLQLSTSLPLSSVTLIDTQQTSSFINIAFYTRPFHKTTLTSDEPLELLTSDDTKTLDSIRSWLNN